MTATQEMATMPSSDIAHANFGASGISISGAHVADMVNDAYEHVLGAVVANRPAEQVYQLPGYDLVVNGSGALSLAVLTAAFGHLAAPRAEGTPRLVWRIADTADAPGTRAHVELFQTLRLPDQSQYGEFQWTQDRSVLLERRGNMVTVFEAEKNRFTTIVDDIRNLDSDFAAKPLLRFLMGLFADKGYLVCHAALLGGAKGGLLVTGKGGMGKSTISAATVLGGAGFASDDFVALQSTPDGLIGHSVFATLMLTSDHLRNFPQLGTIAAGMPVRSPRKTMVPLASTFPGQMRRQLKIDAIAVPQIISDPTSSLVPARLSHVLRALVPSSVFSSPWRNEGQGQELMDLGARCIPLSYKSGSDFSRISQPIKERYDV